MDEACRKGDLEAVQAMCLADARRAGEKDAGGVTPLHRAAAGNHVEVCEFLVQSKANINAVDRYLETPLKRAVYNGHVDVLIALLEMGADLNFPDSQGKMVIHHAAEQGHLQCVEMMLEKGASVNAEVVGYLTPLHFAAMNGHTGCVRVLIEAGALLDAQGGQSNQAALHMAAEGGHTSTVRVLLDEGADVELEDSQGRRPALCSADRKTRDVFDGFILRRSCHPASCRVSGPGITPTTEACDVVRFVIQPRDANNRELRDPGGLIVFTVEIQDRTTGEVQEAHVEPCPEFFNSLCYWDASRAGQYAVHVRQENALPDGVTSGPGSSMPIGALQWGHARSVRRAARDSGSSRANLKLCASALEQSRSTRDGARYMCGPSCETLIEPQPDRRQPVSRRRQTLEAGPLLHACGRQGRDSHGSGRHR
jgi:ankyrin repeat protein